MLSVNKKGMECRICSSKNSVKLYHLFDDRYGYPGSFNLVKCVACEHKMLQGDFQEELLKELYTQYYPRASFEIDKYEPHQEISGYKAWLNGLYRSAFRWVPRNVRILDIGCGFGESLGYHESRGCEVYGVEADKNVMKIAEKYGYKIHIGPFDPDVYKENYFDYITMDQVIEHIIDPVTTLRGISKILKQDGRVILSTPNSNGWGAWYFKERWINWHVPYHLHYFSEKSIGIAAEKSGLVLEKVKMITSSEWLHYQWIHLAMYPQMGRPSEFWSSNGRLNIYQKIVVQILHFIHKAKVNHCITRFFDSLGIGDNYIIFLRKPI